MSEQIGIWREKVRRTKGKRGRRREGRGRAEDTVWASSGVACARRRRTQRPCARIARRAACACTSPSTQCMARTPCASMVGRVSCELKRIEED